MGTNEWGLGGCMVVLESAGVDMKDIFLTLSCEARDVA